MGPACQIQVLSPPLAGPGTLVKVHSFGVYLSFLICAMEIITDLPQRVVRKNSQ